MAYSIAVAPCSSSAARRRNSASVEPSLVLFWTIIVLPPGRSLSQQRRQVRDQRDVGRRHRIVLQPVRPHPGEVLALLRPHESAPSSADIEWHHKMEIRITVTRKRERRETRLVDDDPKFLLQLPDQGRFRRFVQLDLAAGEFPQAG